MDAKRLDEIRERCAKATPGPWTGWGSLEPSDPAMVTGPAPRGRVALLEDDERAENDAAFIASARTDVPDLLAEVERLTAEVAGLKRESAWLRRLHGGSLSTCTGDADTCQAESGECSACSVRCCEYGDELHFHHDSCPSEYFAEREAALKGGGE